MISNKKIGELIYKSVQGTLTEPEVNELTAWRKSDPANQQIFNEIVQADEISNIFRVQQSLSEGDSRLVIWNKIVEKLPEMATGRTIGYRKMVAIAATLLATIGIAAYFIWQMQQTGGQKVSDLVADIKAPQVNSAVITLADGRKVSLDSLASGTLAVQGDQQLVKAADGRLVYQQGNNAKVSNAFNTLENPRGSKVVDLVLSDGTHVWLNAGSAITFPVEFVGAQRKVILQGEAYLDVAHNAQKPFIVQAGGAQVQVLGTGFNVKAYQQDEDVKVTLLKGSVKLLKGAAEGLLKPGQQGVISNDIRVRKDIDLNAVMAWKNNKFVFDDASITEVMQQLETWYDIDVVYETKPLQEQFVGSISRNVNLSQILALLEETNIVRFEVKGKKVFVSEAKK